MKNLSHFIVLLSLLLLVIGGVGLWQIDSSPTSSPSLMVMQGHSAVIEWTMTLLQKFDLASFSKPSMDSFNLRNLKLTFAGFVFAGCLGLSYFAFLKNKAKIEIGKE